MGIINKFFTLKWILILAAFLRLIYLDRVPLSLNWDEVSMGYTAYSIGTNGKDEWGEFLPIFFRSYGEWKSAVYIYLLVPFVKILGLNAWAVRLPSALFGIVAVYLMYLLGQRLYNTKIGLWSALFMAITPWHLVLSRPAFEANVSLTLVLAGIYFFIKNTSFKLGDLMLSAVFFGLAPHTYNSAKIIVPFIVFYLVFVTRLYQKLRLFVLYFALLGIFAFPIIVNMFSGVAQYRYTQVGVTTDQTSLTSFYEIRKTMPFPESINKLLINKFSFFVYKVTDNYFSYFNPAFLFIEAGDHRQHHVPYRGLLYLSQAILLIYGLLSITSSKPKSALSYLPLVIILLGFVPGSLTRDTEHVLRSILAIPGFVMLTAIGAFALWTHKTKIFQFVSFFLVVESLFFVLTYFIWYGKATARDWQYGYQQVAAYLADNEEKYDQIVMTKWFGEPQLFLAFYNKWDPIWYQQQNQKLITYEKEGRLWLDQLPEYSFGKYTFRYLNWPQETRTKNTLYVGKWDDFYLDSDYQKTIYYPDGTVAFHLVQGEN